LLEGEEHEAVVAELIRMHQADGQPSLSADEAAVVEKCLRAANFEVDPRYPCAADREPVDEEQWEAFAELLSRDD
jgi:hypothetical protein